MRRLETLAFLLQTAVVTRALFLMPFEGRRKYRRLLAELERDPHGRVRFFRRFLVSWWSVAAVVVASVALGSDTPANLRLVPPNWTALPLSVVWLGVLAWPVLRARSDRGYREAVREQLDRVPGLLPSTRAERWLFAAVSVTAGVCEELVFRGLLPLYFAKLLPGLPGWAGVAIGVAGFGVAHAYQGLRGVLQASLLGAVFATATAISGSVLTAMAFHALNDLRFLAVMLVLGRSLVDKTRDSP